MTAAEMEEYTSVVKEANQLLISQKKEIQSKDQQIKDLEEKIKNIEEKAFWAARCGLKTLVTDGNGFFTNDISIVNTIEQYRNHPNYQSYIDNPYPSDEILIKKKEEYFNKTRLK